MGIRKITEVSEPGDIHLCEPWQDNDYGEWKFNIRNAEPEDAPILKELEWNITHRKWDDDYHCWTADLDSMFIVAAHMINNGYEVTFDDDVLVEFGDKATPTDNNGGDEK